MITAMREVRVAIVREQVSDGWTSRQHAKRQKGAKE
jgi:hypothetical protein